MVALWQVKGKKNHNFFPCIAQEGMCTFGLEENRIYKVIIPCIIAHAVLMCFL